MLTSRRGGEEQGKKSLLAVRFNAHFLIADNLLNWQKKN